MKTFFVLICLFCFSLHINAQHTAYGKHIVEKLCSRSLAGRGYVGNGQKKAAKLIIKELKKWKVSAFNKQYEQYFTFAVNTFPSAMSVKIDDQELEPGIDYVVDPSCPSIKGKFGIYTPDSAALNRPDSLKRVFPEKKKNDFIILDPSKASNKNWERIAKQFYVTNPIENRGFLEITDREPMFGVSSKLARYPILNIKRDKIGNGTKNIDIDIENLFIDLYVGQNISGFIEGRSDSLIVLSAHYDHLGKMGKKTYFPGANDNASGVALVLSLAKYFAEQKEKPKYTIAFVFFAGEEAGLLGSSFMRDHPLFPHSKIKMMLNLDLEGSGDKGLTIVNGLSNKEGKKILEINTAKNYFKDIKLIANRPNSDHYPFAAAGINAFYLFARGEYSYYHSPKDDYKYLPMNGFENIHSLIIDLISAE